MSSRTAIFVALPVAGLVALGAYAYYSNRAPGPLQGSAEGRAEKGAAPNPAAKGPGGSPAGIVVARVSRACAMSRVSARCAP